MATIISSVQCDMNFLGNGIGIVVVEAEIKNDDGKRYLSLAEVDSVPCLYLTPFSTFKQQMEEVPTDEQFWETMNKEYALPYENYPEVFMEADPVMRRLLRYVIYLARCSQDKEQPFIRSTVGRNIMEVDIPMSSVEREWIGLQTSYKCSGGCKE